VDNHQFAASSGLETGWVVQDAGRLFVERKMAENTVFIVDDDECVRETLSSLLRSVGLRVQLFGSPIEFLNGKRPDVASCLVLDIRLPGLSGLDFQNELLKAGIQIPIVFITGHGDISMSVKAMKAGAIEFLTKPIREQDLLDAVQLALERDRTRRGSEATLANVKALFSSLTPREREVFVLVTTGLMNKQIASELAISEVMVKVHRGNVMRKMAAASLADLVLKAQDLGIRSRKTRQPRPIYGCPT
jgi:FixJ family two-component response regulator